MRTHQRHGAPARFLLPLALTALLGVAACSGEEGATDDDVATLGADDGSTDGDDDGGGGGGEGGGQPDAEFQDAMLEFAECMREQGIDFPDPQVQGEGEVIISGPATGGGDGPPSEAEMAEMEAANEECRPILEAVEGAFEEPDPEQIQEMQDQALEFAQCMREHGIDMPDPEFGEGGRITQSVGGPGGGGIDFEDEDFQAAQEACAEEGGPGGGPGIVVGGPGAGSSSAGDDGEDG